MAEQLATDIVGRGHAEAALSLPAPHILAGIRRFARDRPDRTRRLRDSLAEAAGES